MGEIRLYRELDVWQASMDLAVTVQKLADRLPADHRFGLASRSSLSIPSNVAEGHAYGAERIFLRHVRIALASLAEVETQIELAKRLDLLRSSMDAALPSLLVRTGQLLHGTRRSLMKRLAASHKKREK